MDAITGTAPLFANPGEVEAGAQAPDLQAAPAFRAPSIGAPVKPSSPSNMDAFLAGPQTGAVAPQDGTSFLDRLTSSFKEQHGEAWNDIDFGRQLVFGNKADNIAALEHRRLTEGPGKAQKYDPQSWWKYVTPEWLGELAGSSAAGMEAGLTTGVAGAAGGSVVPGIGTAAGALGGTAFGVTTATYLQTAGQTMYEAYKAYVHEGFKPEDAYARAYRTAQLDGLKSGALAGFSVLAAPARAFGPASQVLTSQTSRAVGNAAAQSLAIQPGLEVADQVTSNLISSRTFSQDRHLTEGLFDAYIGSVFFDAPTVAVGGVYNKLKGRGFFSEADPRDTTSDVIEDVKPEKPVAESTPYGPPTEDALSHAEWVQSQINRMNQLDREAIANNPSYTGNPKLAQAVGFMRYLAEGEAQLEAVRAIDDPVERASPENVTRAQNARDRIKLLEMMRDPLRFSLTPDKVWFQSATKHRPASTGILMLDENGQPLMNKGKHGLVQYRVFHPSTGELSWVNEKSGQIIEVNRKEANNILYSAAALNITNTLMADFNATQKALLGQDQVSTDAARTQVNSEVDNKARAVAPVRGNDPVQGAKAGKGEKAGVPAVYSPQSTALEMVPDKDLQAALANRNMASEFETARRALKYDDLEPVYKLAQKLADTGDSIAAEKLIALGEKEAKVQASIQEKIDAINAEEEGVNREKEIADKIQKQIDAINAEEAALVKETAKAAAKEGKRQTIAKRREALAQQKASLVQRQAETRITFAAARNVQLGLVGRIPMNSLPHQMQVVLQAKRVRSGQNLGSEFTTKEELVEMGVQEHVARSFADRFRYAAGEYLDQPRPGLVLGRGVRAMLEAVAPDQRRAVERLLKVFQKSLGRALTETDVVDLGAYMSMTRGADDPRAKAAFIGDWVQQIGDQISRGAVALRPGATGTTDEAVRNVAHELTHLAMRVHGVSENSLADLWRAVPDFNPTKARILIEPGYQSRSESVLGDELLTFMVEDALAGRFSPEHGYIRQFVKQIVELLRDVWSQITGADPLISLMTKAAKEYGIDLDIAFGLNKASYPGLTDRFRLDDTTNYEGTHASDFINGSTFATSIEKMRVNIPEGRRVVGTRDEQRRLLPKADLESSGHGLDTSIDQGTLDDMWATVIDTVEQRYGTSGKLRRFADARISPPPREFVDQALRLSNRSRYWYEISAQGIEQRFTFADGDALSRVIDVIAATSIQANPHDNLRRTLSVLSSDIRNVPDPTDLLAPSTVYDALYGKDPASAPKIRSFGGTMKYVLGLSDEKPLSTNDRQVASYFGLDSNVIARNPILYEVFSEYHLALRDLINKSHGTEYDQVSGAITKNQAGTDPYQTWQLQAMFWVQERALKNIQKEENTRLAALSPAERAEYFQITDDYLAAIDAAGQKLAAAGVSLGEGGAFTSETMTSPMLHQIMASTGQKITDGSVTSTSIETANSARGAMIADAVSTAEQAGDVQMVAEHDAAVGRAFRKLSARHAEGTSLADSILSFLNDGAVVARRVETGKNVSAEGAAQSLRIPMKDLPAPVVRAFLAYVGKAWRQDSNSANIVRDADSFATPVREGHYRTASVFVPGAKWVTEGKLAELKNLLGDYELSYTQKTNGVLIDVIPTTANGYEHIRNLPAFFEATRQVLGEDRRILARDFQAEYLVDASDGKAQTYDEAINAHRHAYREDLIERVSNERVSRSLAAAYLDASGAKRADVFGNAVARGSGEAGTGGRRARAPRASDERALSKAAAKWDAYRASAKEYQSQLRKIATEFHQDLTVKQDAKGNTWVDRVSSRVAGNTSPVDTAPVTPEVTAANDGAFPSITGEDIRFRLGATAEKTSGILRDVTTAVAAGNRVPDSLMTATKWATFWTSTAAQLRAIGTDTAFLLGNHFDKSKRGFVGPDKQGPISFTAVNGAPIQGDLHSEIRARRGHFAQKVAQLLNMTSKAQLEKLPDAMDTGRANGVPQSLLSQMRDFTDGMYEYMRKAYIEGGADPTTLAPKLKNYFPHIYDLDSKFKRGSVKGMDKRVLFEKFLQGAGFEPGTATSVAMKIQDDDMVPTWGFDLSKQLGGRTHEITGAELQRFIDIDPTQKIKVKVGNTTHDLSLSDFLLRDPLQVLPRYTEATIRRAEFIRRFGPKGEKINELLDQIKIERENKGQAFTPADRARAIKLVRANVGLLGREFISDHPTLYQAQNVATLGVNMAFLPLSAITSLPEFFTPAVRFGLRGLAESLNQNVKDILRIPSRALSGASAAAGMDGTVGDRFRAFKHAYRMDNNEMRQFALDIGVILEHTMHALHDNVETTNQYWTDRASNWFFRVNGLQALTDMQRVGATAAAVKMIEAWGRKAGVDPRSARFLREVGLTVEDLKDFDGGNLKATTNDKINAAIRQMVDQTVIEPTAGKKPAWMSDPRYRLFAQIQGFTTAFNNTVLQRVGTEALAERNFMPLIYLVGYAAIAGLIYNIREWLRYGEEGNPYYARLGLTDDDPAKQVLISVQRGGLLGPMEPFFDLVLGTRTGRQADVGGQFMPFVGFANNLMQGFSQTMLAVVDNDEEMLRRAVSSLSKSTPFINVLGAESREGLLTSLTGIEKPSSGNKKKGGGATATSLQVTPIMTPIDLKGIEIQPITLAI